MKRIIELSLFFALFMGQAARAQMEPFGITLTKAQAGDPIAQCNLGEYYVSGTDVEPSPTEATKWWRKAAEQGHADAQNNMGYYLYNGIGVEKSKDEAIKWWKKAAKQGRENAIDALKRLGIFDYD